MSDEQREQILARSESAKIQGRGCDRPCFCRGCDESIQTSIIKPYLQFAGKSQVFARGDCAAFGVPEEKKEIVSKHRACEV